MNNAETDMNERERERLNGVWNQRLDCLAMNSCLCVCLSLISQNLSPQCPKSQKEREREREREREIFFEELFRFIFIFMLFSLFRIKNINGTIFIGHVRN